MKIYTKTGDKGDTALCDGKRVPKDSLRVCAFGDIDELSSHLGLCAAQIKNRRVKYLLNEIQQDLFVLSSHIATPKSKDQRALPKFPTSKTKGLEKAIDEIYKGLKPLTHFILPGGTKESAFLHIARAVCRRAERSCVSLAAKEDLFGQGIPYLNRLSDLLFVIARHLNKGKDILA